MAALDHPPETLFTDRLLLRRPQARDADPWFEDIASDPEVTRYVGWPTHRSVQDTRDFLAYSDSMWERWPAGPYAIFPRGGGRLIGSTGLMFESEQIASTGYVIARASWGRGVATEALGAMIELAARCGVRRLYALCHPDNVASRRVLEKGGMRLESIWQRADAFPNLEPGCVSDVCHYTIPPTPGS